MIPIINDFKKPQLTKTEKAVAMLQQEIEMLKNWNQGLQRQIAGILIHLKVTPNQFSINTRQQDEINKYLEEAGKAEELMMQAEQREKEEQNKDLELLKPKENGQRETENSTK